MSRAEVVLVGSSQATAGQTFTLTFQLVRDGTARSIGRVACYAIAGGRLAQLVDKGTDGTTGHCTWTIPRRAKGRTIDGIISAQGDQLHAWHNRGFDLPIS